MLSTQKPNKNTEKDYSGNGLQIEKQSGSQAVKITTQLRTPPRVWSHMHDYCDYSCLHYIQQQTNYARKESLNFSLSLQKSPNMLLSVFEATDLHMVSKISHVKSCWHCISQGRKSRFLNSCKAQDEQSEKNRQWSGEPVEDNRGIINVNICHLSVSAGRTLDFTLLQKRI
jgi:hypothetical protein